MTNLTRAEAIAVITARLADLDKLDDIQLATIAEALELAEPAEPTPLRNLSVRERTLLDQSRADFAEGRSYSHEEAWRLIDDKLAELGIPKSK